MIVERDANRPDLKALVVGGDVVEIVVDTRRDWYRTGLIIEKDCFYCIEYVGGLSRDAECPPARPIGQRPKGLDIRYLMGFGRRLPGKDWMLLGATIAHPRAWNPIEKPFHQAIPYLLWSAPEELRSQIAEIGQHLAEPNDKVFLTSSAPSGLLYLFANDWWQTAANNSGGQKLRISRVGAPDAGENLWSLCHKTMTGPDSKEMEVNQWTPSEWYGSQAANVVLG
jgi:hypothetical protein